jgi:iron-sulfur cluster assembly protein
MYEIATHRAPHHEITELSDVIHLKSCGRGNPSIPSDVDSRFAAIMGTCWNSYDDLRQKHHKTGTSKSVKVLSCKSTMENIDSKSEERAIFITPNAMNHLKHLTEKVGSNNCLRMGVKAGGCSGMSYVMDFISDTDLNVDDYIEEYDGIKCAMDPKSLLYLYGLQLDYSNELIGGGFKFSNPNAETSCGCGKSFGV